MKLPKPTKRAMHALLLGAALLLLVAAWGHCGQPRAAWSRSSLQSARYEGFGRMHDMEYTTYPENAVADSNQTPFAGAAGTSYSPARLAGYPGLQTAPNAAFEPLDAFSQAVGSVQCEASGLSNSRGPLCLDATQRRLLSSRGGNLSSGDSQIG